MKCPECDEDVRVGTAGPAGIVQHQGKKPCIKACEAKEEEGRIWTLFQVGVKKVPTSSLTASKASSNLQSRPITVSFGMLEFWGCTEGVALHTWLRTPLSLTSRPTCRNKRKMLCFSWKNMFGRGGEGGGVLKPLKKKRPWVVYKFLVPPLLRLLSVTGS